MYRIPILEVESTVVLFDPEEKRMIRELNERLDCGENDVIRDAVREYYKQTCRKNVGTCNLQSIL